MTFDYWPVQISPTPLLDSDVIHRPFVPLHVIYRPDRDTTYLWALADTGTDHTLFPASVGETLGISLDAEDTTTVVGFGGTELTVTTAHVDLFVADHHRRLHWTATVGFVEFDKPDHEVAVLGHGGFFEFFAATFDSSAQQLSLIPTAAYPGTVDTVFTSSHGAD